MRKFLFSFGLVFALFGLSITPSYAQQLSVPENGVQPPCAPLPADKAGHWWDIDACNFMRKVEDAPPSEIFGERYTYAQVNWIVNSLLNILTPAKSGADVAKLFNNLVKCGQDPTACKTSGLMLTPTMAQAGGLPGLFLGLIGDTLSNPPASGIDTIQDSLAKFNLAQPVNAQGYGYQALNSIQIVWTASRNITYMLMVLLLLVAGFMIMFRVKINAQAAVSLQLMIPRIIITLVLITFSYAIAGLVIDLVYVALSFIISIMGIVGLLNAYIAVPNFANNGYYMVVITILAPWLLAATLGGITAIVNGVFTGILQGALSAILTIIMLIAIVFVLVKVYFMLFKTYINMIFLIILGPWQILFGLLPSSGKDSNVGFGAWFKNLVAQASVFVVVPLMFILNILLWNPPNPMDLYTNTFRAWSIGSEKSAIGGELPSMPLFGAKGDWFNFIASFVILSLTPKAAEIVRDALKASKFGHESAIGEALAPALAIGGAAGSGAMARGRQAWANIRSNRAASGSVTPIAQNQANQRQPGASANPTPTAQTSATPRRNPNQP